MRSWGESTGRSKRRTESWLITADHGNAEMMVDPVTGGPHTAHTTNPVPFIYVADEASHYGLRMDGSLRDISPTLQPAQTGAAEADDRRRHANPDREVIASGSNLFIVADSAW